MLEDHLRRTGLCGTVATPTVTVLQNVIKMLTGHPEYTFGLTDWRTSDQAEAVAALNGFAGEDVAQLDLVDGRSTIDAARTVDDLRRQRDLLWEVTARPGARVVVATGHPTGMLDHYLELVSWCRTRGARVVTELEDPGNGSEDPPGGMALRYVGGVGCAYDGRNLLHTHRAALMEPLLDHLEQRDEVPDLVIGDHGMAGAAVERGLPTLAIADINDPALPLAYHRGRCDTVVMIDDNLPPCTYAPVTRFLTDLDQR